MYTKPREEMKWALSFLFYWPIKKGPLSIHLLPYGLHLIPELSGYSLGESFQNVGVQLWKRVVLFVLFFVTVLIPFLPLHFPSPIVLGAPIYTLKLLPNCHVSLSLLRSRCTQRPQVPSSIPKCHQPLISHPLFWSTDSEAVSMTTVHKS